MTLFIDCSTLITEEKPLTGIPRTVECLSISIMNLEPKAVLIGYDDMFEGFHYLKEKNNQYVLDRPVPFQNGDIIFTASATWLYSSYNNSIRNLRNNGVLFYSCFYDLIPYKYPYTYRDGKGFGSYFGGWCKQIFSNSNGAFAISECTKKKKIELFNLNNIQSSKIDVIKLGTNFQEIPGEINHAKKFGESKSFLIYVSSLGLRKNHIVLLNAYRKLLSSNIVEVPKLIFVGRNDWNNGEIDFQVENDPLIKNHVRIEHNVNDEELTWLYKNCLFSLYPSFYEGWGLPIAEGLSHGRPCIISGTSSMLEVAPEFSIFASPFHVEDWVNCILFYLINPNELKKDVRNITKNYRPDLWDAPAKDILKRIFLY